MNWHISCVNSYMKLYIISNRLPVKVTKEDETFVFSRSEGGLATGLDSLQISYEKHWIGLDGLEYALTTKKVKRKSLLDWKE